MELGLDIVRSVKAENTGLWDGGFLNLKGNRGRVLMGTRGAWGGCRLKTG